MDPRIDRLRKQRQRQIERLRRVKLLRRPGSRQASPDGLGSRRLFVILAFLVALIASVGGAVWSTRPQTLTVAAPRGEPDVIAFAERLQGAVSDTTGRRLRVVVTPVETVEAARDLLAQGSVQLAIVRSDVEPAARARSVAYLREDVALFLALREPPAVPPAPAAEKRVETVAARPEAAVQRRRTGRVGRGDDRDRAAGRSEAAATAGKADDTDDESAKPDAAPGPAADVESLQSALKGRAVGLLSGKPSEGLLKVILAKHGLGEESVTLVRDSWEPLIDKLGRREIAALFVVESPLDAGFGPRLAVAASGPAGPRLRVLAMPQGQALAKQTQGVASYELDPGELLGGPTLPDEAVETVSVTWRLVTRADVSPQLIETLSKGVFERRSAFADTGSIARTLKAPPIEKDVYVPIHPGTLVYVNEEPKGMLELYGDYVYIGLALAGLIASASGYVLSRIRRYAEW